MLCLIGTQHYEEALATIESVPAWEGEVVHHFNRAMALWGRDGRPSVPVFETVSALSNTVSDRDANYHQCMALTHVVLSDSVQASEHIASAREEAKRTAHRIFSCWRYLYVPDEEFLRDVDAIELLARGDGQIPSFMTEQPSSTSAS